MLRNDLNRSQPDRALPSSAPPRVIFVGETGVGKTLLLSTLASALLGVNEIPQTEKHAGGTVAFNAEAIVWRDMLRNRAVILELVEISGNRSFGSAARSALFQGRTVCGVVYVYDSNNSQSAAALMDWHEEIESLGSPLPFLLLGTRLPRKVFSDRLSTGAWMIPFVPPRLLDVWAWLQYVVLVVMSMVLFGWSHTISSRLKPRQGRKALQQLQEHPLCAGLTDDCSLQSVATFNENRVELNSFLNQLAFV